jgi:hypothetical protein
VKGVLPEFQALLGAVENKAAAEAVAKAAGAGTVPTPQPIVVDMRRVPCKGRG